MELLLNLFWLMLAVSALWSWRRAPVSAQKSRRFDSVHCLLSLGCILMLLFPVISVTDDLHAMRQEAEESSSSPSKLTLKRAAVDKAQCWPSGFGTAPSQLISPSSFCPNNEVCGQVLTQPILLPVQARLGTRAGRAPPLSLLG